MRIVLDANALFDDPVMLRTNAQRVLDLLGPAQATLVFSPVVLAELRRQRKQRIEDLHATAAGRIRKLARLAGSSDVEATLQSVRSLTAEAHERWEARWRDILSQQRVELAKWPATDARQMVERELERRRPFLDKEPGTIGHRDTLIWLGVMELAHQEPDEDVIFVTSDKGFLGDDGLHAHLVDDLRSAQLEDRVSHLGSLLALVAALQRESEGSGWSDWREPRILELLHDELATLDAADFTPYWDPREGDMQPPNFDLGLPFTGHDWVLTHVEGPQDLTIENAVFGNNQRLECTFVVELSLSGFMDKWEWYADDHPEIELWDADWNEQVVSVETYQSVTFRATVSVDDDSRQAEFVEFIDAKTDAPAGGITVG